MTRALRIRPELGGYFEDPGGLVVCDIDPVTGPGEKITVTAKSADGSEKRFPVTARIDTDVDLEYYRNGGILHTVLRQMRNSQFGNTN